MTTENSRNQIVAPRKPERLGRWETFVASMKGKGSEEWQALEAERVLPWIQHRVQNELALASVVSQRAVVLFEQEMAAVTAFNRAAAAASTECPELQEVIADLLLQHQRSYAELMNMVRQLRG